MLPHELTFSNCFWLALPIVDLPLYLAGDAYSTSLPGTATLVQQGAVRGRRPLLVDLPGGGLPSQPPHLAEFQLPGPDARRHFLDSGVWFTLCHPHLRSGMLHPRSGPDGC